MAASVVHYKFKSGKEFSTLPIGGAYVTVGDLKDSIFHLKHLGGTDYDLLVTNAQTNEVYEDEKMLIHRNTFLLLQRVPGLPRPRIIVPQEDRSKKVNANTKVNVATENSCKRETVSQVKVFSWSQCGIPSEILCPLCKLIMKDAVLPRCCFQSFCLKCIRDHLTSKKMCASCGAAYIRVDDLVPNNTLRKVIVCISEACSNGSSGKTEGSLHVQDSAHLKQSEEPLSKDSSKSTLTEQSEQLLRKDPSKSADPVSKQPLPVDPSSTIEKIDPTVKDDQTKIASLRQGKKACSSASDSFMLAYDSNCSAMSWNGGCMTGFPGIASSWGYAPYSFDASLGGFYPQYPYWSQACTLGSPLQSEPCKHKRGDREASLATIPPLKSKKLVCPLLVFLIIVYSYCRLLHSFGVKRFVLCAALVSVCGSCIRFFCVRIFVLGVFFLAILVVSTGSCHEYPCGWVPLVL